eukprot:1195541-Prorocentrum_minimum.AAC.9
MRGDFFKAVYPQCTSEEIRKIMVVVAPQVIRAERKKCVSNPQLELEVEELWALWDPNAAGQLGEAEVNSPSGEGKSLSGEGNSPLEAVHSPSGEESMVMRRGYPPSGVGNSPSGEGKSPPE